MSATYTYKIKFTIFGKENTAKVKAGNMPEAVFKFIKALADKVNYEDITIEGGLGELSEAEYKAQIAQCQIIMDQMFASQKFEFSQN